MTVPRVQPIERLPDNEHGRCSDWTAGHWGYADFYDDRSSLQSCRFAPQPNRIHDNGSLTVERCFGDQKHPFDQSLTPNVPLYDELPSFCNQFRDCSQNGLSMPRNCQLGPVDVEDLALYFEPEKSQESFPRAYNRVSNFLQFRRARVKYSQYMEAPTIKQLPTFTQNNGSCGNESGCDSLLDGRFCDGCPQPFTYCTEERWLQCPASDRCPLYNTAYPYEQNVLPPCAYENRPGENWWQGYHEDEHLLEDYL